MNAKKVPLLPPEYTTAERNGLRASLRKIGCIIYNTTTGQHEKWNGSAWMPFVAGSFTPLDYIVPPSDTDTSRQAFLIALHNEMLTKSMMLPAPTYTISGAITGDILSGVTLELRDNATNTLITSVVSDAGGNYAFPAQPTGTYKVIPSLAGYVFNPLQAVQNLVADVTVNFASVQFSYQPHASPNYFLVPQNGQTHRLRVVNRVTKAVETTPASFNVFTNDIATPTYANGRWFIADKTTSVRVFDESWTLMETIVFPNPIRFVVKAGNKFLAATDAFNVHTNTVQFFTYDYGTDEATLGTVLSNCGVYDMAANDVSVFGVASNILSVVDIAGETLNNIALGSSVQGHIALTETHLYIGANNYLSRVNLDGSNYTTLLNTPYPGSNFFSNTKFAYAQGQIWYNKQAASKLFRYDIANNLFFDYSQVQYPSGVITDGTDVYAADTINSFVHIFDAATGVQDPFPNNRITGSFFSAFFFAH